VHGTSRVHGIKAFHMPHMPFSLYIHLFLAVYFSLSPLSWFLLLIYTVPSSRTIRLLS
jgi:hypothetical protein